MNYRLKCSATPSAGWKTLIRLGCYLAWKSTGFRRQVPCTAILARYLRIILFFGKNQKHITYARGKLAPLGDFTLHSYGIIGKPKIRGRTRTPFRRQAFCARWGYTCVMPDAALLPKQAFPVAWSKLDLEEHEPAPSRNRPRNHVRTIRKTHRRLDEMQPCSLQ